MINLIACIEQAQCIMIAGHIRPDGDCIGSCMGLYHYIRDNYPEKTVDVRLEKEDPCYRVIADVDQIVHTYDDEKTYDLFVALDASDEGRLGSAMKYFHTAAHTICIDHHISNPYYADENHVLPKASSTCEVLTDLLDIEKISMKAATALYVGLVTDTGVFKHSCTSHHTMDVAGSLMGKGIPYSDLIDDVFYRKTYMQNRLLGRALLDSRLLLSGRMIASIMTEETMADFGAVHSDLEGIIDQLRVTEGVEVAVLVSPSEDMTFRFSMRSNHFVDVSKIGHVFGGGGHVRAAGFTAHESAESALTKVENMVKEQIEACTMA